MGSPATALAAPIFLRWRQARWPSRTSARWATRLLLALPFVALGEVASHLGLAAPLNAQLHAHAASLQWTSGLGWVSQSYPPLTLALARALPGGVFALAIAGAVCAGILIQLTIERLVLRSVPLRVAPVLVAGIVFTPVFWYAATQDFGAILTLTLLSVALTRLLDFVVNRSTESGFVAGLAFGAATMCAPAVPVFALAGGLATVLVTGEGTRTREIARTRAAAAVIVFPSAAALVGWMFLQWRFTGSWVASFSHQSPGVLRFRTGVLRSLESAGSLTVHDLALAPVLVITAAFLLRRRPLGSLACALPVVCVIADQWLGVPLSQTATVLLLAVMGLTVLPQHLTVTERVVLWIGVAAQCAALWYQRIGDPAVWAWFHHLV
jgi:hypothetical protein